MSTSPEDFCKVFVEAPVERDALCARLAAGLGAIRRGRTLTTTALEIDVTSNADYDPERSAAAGGFVFFPFYLDVLSAPGLSRAELIAEVARLLGVLRASGWRAVPACDFEDKLPPERPS